VRSHYWNAEERVGLDAGSFVVLPVHCCSYSATFCVAKHRKVSDSRVSLNFIYVSKSAW